MNIFILHHFGLGDFLSCKGLVSYFIQSNRKKYNTFNLFVPGNHFENIKFLYKNIKSLNLIKVENEKKATIYFKKFSTSNDSELIKIGFGNFYKTIKNDLKETEFTTDMVFYSQMKIPYKKRFELGGWTRNYVEEQRVFKKLNPKNKKFIFIHDDASRNLIIDKRDIQSTSKDILVIKNDITEPIFNLALILEKAEEIHVMESSIRQLIECLNIESKKLFLHSFRKNLSKGPFYSTKTHKIVGSQINWKIVSSNTNNKKSNYLSGKKILAFLKFFFISKLSGDKIISNDVTLMKRIKFFIVFYFLKKQALVNLFSLLIEKLQIKKDIGINIFKIDFHKELDKCTFYTSRSLIDSIGNFIHQKEYPNIKKNITNKDDVEVLFVKSSELLNFATKELQKITKNFILVSGDSDYEITINSSVNINLNTAILKIANNEKLISWYAQNLNFDHKKLFNLPHGLDYHTVFERRKGWAEFKCSPTYQEKKLISTLYNSQYFSDRKEQIFNNWHFSLNHGDRKFYFNQIDKKDNFFLNTRVNRFLNWKIQSNYKYTFCPSGKGIDDPRIYESIILGNVPIRLNDKISKMHNELPIINIDDIKNLNIKFLNENYSNYHNRKFCFTKLFLAYWKNELKLIEKIDLRKFENISLDQFRLNLIEFYFKSS